MTDNVWRAKVGWALCILLLIDSSLETSLIPL